MMVPCEMYGWFCLDVSGVSGGGWAGGGGGGVTRETPIRYL